MKKVLSVLLAVVIGVGFGVCAFAAPEPGVKTVTGIEAVWNGEADVYLFRMEPSFTPETVTVTLFYEDGSLEVLTSWDDYDDDYNWSWDVFYLYDAATRKVTFYYSDVVLAQAYFEPTGKDWIRYYYMNIDFYATLPQTSFTVPADTVKNVLASMQTPLKFEERLTILAEPDGEMLRKVFSFVPEKSGMHYFYSEKTDANPYAILWDADLNEISQSKDNIGNNFLLPAKLEAGKMYYLHIGALNGYGDMTFDLVVSDKAPKMNAVQWIVHYLLGGWILARNNIKIISR